MKAVDTSVLVAALASRSPLHAAARGLLAGLAEGRAPWALPWPCVHETVRLVTDGALFRPPMALDAVRRDVAALAASPSVVLLSEGERHLEVLDRLLQAGQAVGRHAELARIAALCVEHGVSELLSTDLDFARFPGLVVRHPFVNSSPAGARRRGRSAR